MRLLLVGRRIEIKNALKFGQSVAVKIVDVSLFQSGA